MVHRQELLHAGHFSRHYRRVEPSPALAPLVAEIWRLESYAALPQGVGEHFLPALQGQIVFAQDNRCLYQQRDGEGKAQLRTVSGPHLVGAQQGTLARLHPASRGIVGISFRPGALALVTDQAQADQIRLCPQWAAFEAKLADKDFDLQVELIEKWLSGLLAGKADLLQPLTRALASLQRAESADVERAAYDAGLSARTLQRHCRDWIGLSPRTCRRILRLRGTLGRLWQDQAKDFSVWDSAYYDYAHFYREFRAFSGQSPTEYLRIFA